MELLVLGLSHKTAPVSIREQYALADEALVAAASRAREVAGCRESFVVSTCNRVELWTACDDAAQTRAELILAFAEVGRTHAVQLTPHLYVHHGQAALLHLFRVASSLDSLVVGEPQILGQLKAAYEHCRIGGVTGPSLHRAIERAFAVAKRVRSETGIGKSVVSISSVAVDLARQIFDSLDRCTVLLVGAGKMGELAARHFRRHGAHELLVANRSFDRARAVAEALGGHPRGLDELESLLVQADIVVTSTGAPGYLVTAAMVRRVVKARKYRPLFFIDIAVPRNVDPVINSLDNVYVYDVDDLSGIANENLAGRHREAFAAETLVAAEASRYQSDLSGHAIAPTLAALRRHADTVRDAELERASKRLGGLDEKQRKAVEQLVDGAMNKLLHDVFSTLKDAARTDDGAELVAAARRLFRLDESKE
ncbi:MAG: glutamyl-tRNA reductase [Myxococcales bacterium]|nr:glutamyl-tRNA reductase [Myxococcales bacterium]